MVTTNKSRCPSCGKRGSVVKPITIESLVTESARSRAGRTEGFHFCAGPSCDVVYFHPESGATIARSEVRVRIGEKESGPPHPVCYCFGHTVEDIEAEVETTGTSKIAEGIAEKCRQGLHCCVETNPRGSCCLGHVRRAVREAPARRGSTSNAAPKDRVGHQSPACCVTGPGGAERQAASVASR